MLKSLRFLPLCVLVFSGYVFADSGNSSSDRDVANRTAFQTAPAKVAAASGDDDLLIDLKGLRSGLNEPKSGVKDSTSDTTVASCD
ncbi:hypothetical protein RJF20_003134 [Salmonella enterica]|nr:hypothetical protein [Salmonella enterica]